ncbi:putative ankyrin repeat domain-containing protein [Cladorrhinum samala]|uniref:Ankyrin repeat domain-containing protein n=1 Tax=Cladorrhinum samala TaxID=585594 RepID=A0AAV9HJD5_9PEZI|nr:putative ankyrin repeat domain-containing protein [Cladorrhinum samala]
MQRGAMDLKRPLQTEEDSDPDATWNHPKRPRTRTFDNVYHLGVPGSCDEHYSHQLTHQDYTIAWICALHLELAVSRAMLDEVHRGLPNLDRDDNVYVLGRIHQHNVVMVCLPGQYGTNNAAIVATNLKRSFPNLRATLMVGIGGGSPSQADLYLGDVVVGTRIIQYDLGKVTAGGLFQGTAEAKTPSQLLSSAVMALRSKYGPDRSHSHQLIGSLLQSRLPNILRPKSPDRLFQASYEHLVGASTCINCDLEKLQPRAARVSEEPRIHYGVIASGNRVMKDGKARDDIAQRHSVLCFEMEAAGMMDNLQCLPIRGICDYSDSHKNKEWQDYAAATAAAYARELLQELPPSSRKREQTPTYIADASQPNTADDYTLERRQCLLKSLEFPQIDARRTAIRAAHTKTCRWLLLHSKYQEWLDPGKQEQNHGFLWMQGKAGAGKSTMMKFVYLETKKKTRNPSKAVASFFFNARGDYLERSVSGMYRSLLLQLLQVFPDLQTVLDDTDIVPRNQQDCPDLNALKELLNGTVMGLGRRCFTCFVDALDECDELEVRDMVQFFEELAENATEQGIQFRICFSSRPYPYIDIHWGTLFTLEEESGHGEDLAQYVESRLRITNPSLRTELQSKILEKATGIFMWIVLVVEILNNECIHGALALRKKLSEIPTQLSELFRSMLTRDQERPESLKLCILWVLLAKRPLSPAEFRHALWAGLLEQGLVDAELPDDTHMDAVKLVTSSSKGLAEIAGTKSKQPTVQFIHESVRDFLLKEKGVQELWPELGFGWEAPSHEILKRCCTTYLYHPRVHPIFVPAEGGDTEQIAMAEKCSFLEYASQQVLYHADAAAPVVPQDDFLTKFFASAGTRAINYFEKFESRRYSSDATPLYVLADRGLGNLIRIQMKRESPIRVPRARYKYPLFAALANDHKSAIAALLGLPSTVYNGSEITKGLTYRKDLKGYRDRTPLSWAAQEGRFDMVALLSIQEGVQLDVTDPGGYTPLHRAAENGHKAIVQLLIDNEADVNAEDKKGSTALIMASQGGYEAIVQLLIDNEADVNARDKYGSTALIMASEQGDEATVQLLIDNGANINIQDKDGETALIWAITNGQEAIARVLIEYSADVNISDKDGRTALIWASRQGQEAVVRVLINHGADVNISDRNGKTALIWASQQGQEAVARVLIDYGADVNISDKNGETALIWASKRDHEAVTRVLINHGTDVNISDKNGETALIWASQYGYEAVARVLINHGADVNISDRNGKTALIWASQQGQEAVARVLIDHGANINTRDSSGRTALDWALWCKHEAVVQLLKRADSE